MKEHLLPNLLVLGVPISIIEVDRLHQFIAARCSENGRALVLHANVLLLNLAYKQEWLRHYFKQADVVFCDGSGVQLGAKLLGYTIPERITYADWTWRLAEFCEAHQLSLFFLGARPGVAEKAANRLRERFPELKIVDTHDGYFDKSPDSIENREVIREINDSQPDILLIGFGMPIQERWLMENWDQLNVKIGLTGGAVFDYISGNLKRAPRWMTDHGLEWLGRLIIEPKRLWKRYIVGNPLFLWRVVKQKIGWDKYDE